MLKMRTNQMIACDGAGRITLLQLHKGLNLFDDSVEHPGKNP